MTSNAGRGIAGRVNDRIQRLEAELIRLQGQLDSLERDWRRIPWLSAFFLLVIPAGIVEGALGVALVILGVVTLMGVAAYLITVRKNEYRGEMDSIRRDLTILRGRK